MVGIFVLLLVFVIGLGVLAQRLRVPYPILFVLGGLLISLVPRLPSFTLDPDLVFFFFLPPLLYIQAFFTSWRDFRRHLRAILLLAIGLVIATTVTVARISHAFIPGMSLAAGFVLGAIVSPPDAIAASAIAQSFGLPRRVITILEGESLVNDATGLVAFNISLAAIGAGGTFVGVAWLPFQFLAVAGGGILVGLAVGWAIGKIRMLLRNAPVPLILAISLLTPFISYLAADPLHVSGVLAVVATGLYLGWKSPEMLRPEARLQATAVWDVIVYLLNGIVFILIGLQLPGILRAIHGKSWTDLMVDALIVNAACIAVRLFWIFPGAFLPRLIFPRLRRTEELPDWRHVLIAGWAGMRGVVSLAAALSLGGRFDFPEAPLVQFLGFSVILVTLVFQGLTLPLLIRWLKVGDDNSLQEEEHEARKHMGQAALARVHHLREEEHHPAAVIDGAERHFEERLQSLHDSLLEDLGWSDRHHRATSTRQVRQALIEVQRDRLLELRTTGAIGDEVMHKLERELDIEQSQLKI